ncbi:hypothetical protein Goklo_029326 [Gossypium klotzschianum]|uniref:RNase H type-1 domain-containing protein n=2 Tax=Gossypium TaxID=3633 RepID=A0A7J8W4F4_9ROSI|nr:hypothetical protein [Gossypium klotzschianum]
MELLRSIMGMLSWGITRDQHGNWILVFNRRLGQCSVFNAELRGILDGLFLLQSRRRIQQILLQTSLWGFEHIPREENAEAYDIAKLAFDKNVGLQLFAACPLNISR